ncbi:MAG TPA: 50S ribosomal protein L22 [Candidatus Tumulicola sp.]
MADQVEQAQQAVAHLRFVRVGPRKLRRVADAIRGKSVREALVQLKFAGVFAAEPIEKLLKSAVANAGNNHDMNTDELYIARITVDGGPGGRFTKRLDPRAQGRAYFKRKRLSHVTVVVSEQPPAKQRKKRPGASVNVAARTRRAPAAAAGESTSKKSTPRKRTAKAAKATAGAAE